MIPACIAGPGSRLYVAAGGGEFDPDFYPEYETFNMVSPRGTGSAGVGVGTGLESTNRIYKQYTGIEYEIPVVTHGGAGVIADVTLSNEPSGMVAESYTTVNSWFVEWRIRWPSPTTGTHSDIVATVTDVLGNETTGTWTLVVGTSGWYFVDDSAASNGAGTLADPFQTIDYARTNTAADAGLILRAGTYTSTVTAGTSGANSVMRWHSTSAAKTFIGYPGETVTVTGGYADDLVDVAGWYLEGGTSFWVSNITFTGTKDKCLYIGDDIAYGGMIYRCILEDNGPGTDGFNSGPVSYTNTTRYGAAIINTVIRDVRADTCAVKMYGCSHFTFRGNWVHDTLGGIESGCLANKYGNPKISVIGNTFESIDQAAIGGNWNGDYTVPLTCTGEFAYNLVKDGGDFTGADAAYTNICVFINKFPGDPLEEPPIPDEPRGPFKFYRNTILGQVLSVEFGTSQGQTDGEVIWRRNVLINGDVAQSPWSYMRQMAANDTTANDALFVFTDQLVGNAAANITNAAGILQGSYLTTYGGKAGHVVQ